MNEDRFWANVEPSGFCWYWLRSKTRDGYGRLTVKHRSLLAHREAYELLVGPIPAGLVLDHLCRNRSCVNPDHLEPVTQKENLSRGFTVYHTRRRKKTQCPKGHPYSSDNVYVIPSTGSRLCRTCRSTKSLDSVVVTV